MREEVVRGLGGVGFRNSLYRVVGFGFFEASMFGSLDAGEAFRAEGLQVQCRSLRDLCLLGSPAAWLRAQGRGRSMTCRTRIPLASLEKLLGLSTIRLHLATSIGRFAPPQTAGPSCNA